MLTALLGCKADIFTFKQDLQIKISALHLSLLQRPLILTWAKTKVCFKPEKPLIAQRNEIQILEDKKENKCIFGVFADDVGCIAARNRDELRNES